MNQSENVILINYADDILETAARRILTHCSATLPELANCTVLLPDLQCATGLRLQLLKQAKQSGHTALLGPTICSLDQWLNDRFPPAGEIPDKVQRELLLVDALKQHPDIFGHANPWHVASDLVHLFDEMTRNNIGIPEDLDEFTRQLKDAYGIMGDAPEPLGMEATVVHRLWQAWHLQLASNQLTDPGIAHLESLATAQPDRIEDYLFFIGFSELSRAELEWISLLLDASKAELLIRYQPEKSPPDGSEPNPIENILAHTGKIPVHTKLSVRAECLETVFSIGEQPLGERASTFQTRQPDSPLADCTRIFPAASAEQEARAIDIQIRQWLIENKKCSIGFITEDRRLARRVRALLERAGISLQDSGGWALSTTSAAATLERWLETIEEDFAHQPLLDTLKSPFVLPDTDRDQHLKTVHHLEQDIVHRENIARGLERYLRQIDFRANRLPDSWTSQTAGDMRGLLNTLDQAADPLRNLNDDEPHRLTAYLDALYESLNLLGIRNAFEDDPAGRRILGEWEILREAAGKTPLEINWLEFRNWFGMALERHDFHLADTFSPVHLLTLEQAQLGQYDAIVIGACNREYLPGKSTISPFFNHAVRADLGLPTWQSNYRLRFIQFRSILERAPRLLMTYTHDKDGTTLPSPWLETLRAFHQLAYRTDLKDPVLDALTRHPDAYVSATNTLPLPAQTTRPAPVLNAALQPERLSASAHQQLIDCPYRFYAAYGLTLKAREEVSEALGKSGYGERVHQCLEAFHGEHPFLPGPFNERLSTDNRDRAIQFLEKISHTVFSHDIEDNFERRTWLKQWLMLIPEYINWQIKHQPSWNVSRVESKVTVQLTDSVTLAGRLDRIDSGPDGLAIIDYKTGQIPKPADVASGEAVQLPSYAMLVEEKTARVDYLQLPDKYGKVSISVGIEAPELDELTKAVRERLLTLITQIKQGTAMPAWGDSKTCQYCDMGGLCRRQVWNTAGSEAEEHA